jgi:1-acyl-sn-glycerol-3-phosphate acyltransferase
MDNRFERISPRYAPSWFWRRFVHSRLVQRVYMWTFKTLFGVRVRNLELVPRTSNYIFAANHGSHYDLFLGLAAAYEITGDVAVVGVWDGVFDLPVIGGMVKAIPCVPIDTRDGMEARRMAAIREMARHLKAGRSLIIACEGERHDHLDEFQHGAAFLSLLTGVPVVPGSLCGVQDLFKEMTWPNRYRGKVEAVMHAPLRPEQFEAEGGTRGEIIERFTQKIREQVAADLDYPLKHAAAK